MTLKKAFIATALLAAPALAQDQAMELVETVGDFQISRVAESKVCFATVSGPSANGIPSFFATYKLTNGDRWQVTGYSEQKEKAETIDGLSIKFDGEPHMVIQIELSNGTYLLPITDETQLKAFDEAVETGTKVSFNLLKTKDSFTVDLANLRAAKMAIDTCLEGMK